MQHISAIIKKLVNIRAKVKITTPGDDQYFLGECDACHFPDQKNYSWNPQCNHRICRLCIKNTLFQEFKGNVMEALECKVFCTACRKTGLHDKMVTYSKELEAWIKANPNRKKRINKPQYDIQPSDSDQDQEKKEEQKEDEEEKINEENEAPQAPGPSSEIRIGHLQPIVPDQVSKYKKQVKKMQQAELRRLQEIQRYCRECTLCQQYKNEKEFISLTPCDHKFCKQCLFDSLANSINQGEVDRDSLVCPECQSYIHYANITKILSQNIALIAKLNEQQHYNNYSSLDYCPQCSSYIYWDSNHDEQRCSCNYQFCKKCLLGAHEDMTCQQKIQAHKTQLQNGNQNMQPTPQYGVCIQCFTYGRKQMGTEIGKCVNCKRYFCCECHQEFKANHECGVNVSEDIMKTLGIK